MKAMAGGRPALLQEGSGGRGSWWAGRNGAVVITGLRQAPELTTDQWLGPLSSHQRSASSYFLILVSPYEQIN